MRQPEPRRNPLRSEPVPKPITAADIPGGAITRGRLAAGAVDELNEQTRVPYDATSGDGGQVAIDVGALGGWLRFTDDQDVDYGGLSGANTGQIGLSAGGVLALSAGDGFSIQDLSEGHSIQGLDNQDLIVTPGTGRRIVFNGHIQRIGQDYAPDQYEEVQEVGTRQNANFGGGLRTSVANQLHYIPVTWQRIYFDLGTGLVSDPATSDVTLLAVSASANYVGGSLAVIAADCFGCLLRVEFNAATTNSYVYGRIRCY